MQIINIYQEKIIQKLIIDFDFQNGFYLFFQLRHFKKAGNNLLAETFLKDLEDLEEGGQFFFISLKEYS